MAAMNISEEFIDLTKGLVVGASSKIHALGNFTHEINLERGVRQGCPLAPLLFALATQPLMTIFNERAAQGRLPGLKINLRKMMLHSLFADDSGVFIQAEEEAFGELQEAVRCYERISGAKLNLQKSTVIPLGLETIPDWLQNSGCHITRKGEIVRYLGFPIGWGISDEDQKAYIVAKLKKKLGTWVFRFLPFAGRVIALRHILRAVPVHVLACLNLQKEMLDAIEGVCRTFLWGSNKEGKPKIPLIAWEEIQRPKNEGGLNLSGFFQTSTAMRLKQVTKFFSNTQEDWVMAGEQLIRTGWITEEERRDVMKTLMRLKLESTTSWRRWAQDHQRTLPEPRDLDTTRRLGNAFLRAQRRNIPIHDWGWFWKPSASTFEGWVLSTRIWKVIVKQPRPANPALNKKWARSETSRRWAKKLQLLWTSQIPVRDKVWTWKILQAGLPTMERVAKWRVDSNLCKRCGTEEETINHLFIECTAVRPVWSSWESACRNTPCEIAPNTDLLQRFEECWKKNNLAKLLLMVKTCRIIWLDRNAATYSNQTRSTPLKVAGRMATITAQAVIENTKEGSVKQDELGETIRVLSEIFPPSLEEPSRTQATHSTSADNETRHTPRLIRQYSPNHEPPLQQEPHV
ncbi:hypothetical protein R1sor_012551 [Riccia sorocarpa]|uniref:Reverse transcriptase domain-containing protein n=1 Tax=Riccia sorocarpa TaxID=122646 RepID=A0ABD3I441_9MARC